jgi:hypothetical protein
MLFVLCVVSVHKRLGWKCSQRTGCVECAYFWPALTLFCESLYEIVLPVVTVHTTTFVFWPLGRRISVIHRSVNNVTYRSLSSCRGVVVSVVQKLNSLCRYLDTVPPVAFLFPYTGVCRWVLWYTSIPLRAKCFMTHGIKNLCKCRLAPALLLKYDE